MFQFSDFRMSRRKARRIFGDDLIINVAPSKIERSAGTQFVGRSRSVRRHALLWRVLGRFMKPGLPFFIDGAAFPSLSPIEKSKKYHKIKNLIDVGIDNYTESEWYKHLIDELGRKGLARHKEIRMSSTDDIDLFFINYVNPMIKSITEQGFSRDYRVDSGVIIDENGNLHRMGGGAHRFYVAKIGSVTPYPVLISGVHIGYVKKICQGEKGFSADTLRQAFRDIKKAHQ